MNFKVIVYLFVRLLVSRAVQSCVVTMGCVRGGDGPGRNPWGIRFSDNIMKSC